MSLISEVIDSTRAIIQGMSVTLSYIPKRKQTVEYPDDPVTLQPRYRGQHLLHVDELGREKCVACFLCAAACPAECIYIEAADDPRPATERTGVDERSTTSIMAVASFAGSASKPVRRTPSPTGTILNSQFTTARTCSRPKTIY